MYIYFFGGGREGFTHLMSSPGFWKMPNVEFLFDDDYGDDDDASNDDYGDDNHNKDDHKIVNQNEEKPFVRDKISL